MQQLSPSTEPSALLHSSFQFTAVQLQAQALLLLPLLLAASQALRR
jgi:hypothetical protein